MNWPAGWLYWGAEPGLGGVAGLQTSLARVGRLEELVARVG